MYKDCPEILKGHKVLLFAGKKNMSVHCILSQVSTPEELQFTLACTDLSPYSCQRKLYVAIAYYYIFQLVRVL